MQIQAKNSHGSDTLVTPPGTSIEVYGRAGQTIVITEDENGWLAVSPPPGTMRHPERPVTFEQDPDLPPLTPHEMWVQATGQPREFATFGQFWDHMDALIRNHDARTALIKVRAGVTLACVAIERIACDGTMEWHVVSGGRLNYNGDIGKPKPLHTFTNMAPYIVTAWDTDTPDPEGTL